MLMVICFMKLRHSPVRPSRPVTPGLSVEFAVARPFAFNNFQHPFRVTPFCPECSWRRVLCHSYEKCYEVGGLGISSQRGRGPMLTPLESTLMRNPPICTNPRGVTSLESILNLLSPLELTLTKYNDLKSHRIILLRKTGGGSTTIFKSAHRRGASRL
jgi:hypothetical protein